MCLPGAFRLGCAKSRAAPPDIFILLANASLLTQLQIVLCMSLIARSTTVRHHGVKVLLEIRRAVKLAFVERTKMVIRQMAEFKGPERFPRAQVHNVVFSTHQQFCHDSAASVPCVWKRVSNRPVRDDARAPRFQDSRTLARTMCNLPGLGFWPKRNTPDGHTP